MEASVIKEGALEKKNEHKTFGMAYSTRWWKLTSTELQYYSKQGGDLRETIPVETIRAVSVVTDKKKETDLFVDEPGRGYKLRANNKTERDAWIDAIQGEVDRIRNKAEEEARLEMEAKLGAQKAKEEAERKVREEKERKKREEARRMRAKDASAPLTEGDHVYFQQDVAKLDQPAKGYKEVFLRCACTADVGAKCQYVREYQHWMVQEPFELQVVTPGPMEVTSPGGPEEETWLCGDVFTVAAGDLIHRASIAKRSEGSDLISDLTELSPLNEASILNALRKRYDEMHSIYTYIGPTLVAINSFCDEDGHYSQDVMQSYIQEGAGRSDDSAPHLFSVAKEVYFRLLSTSKNQAIIITGESGAGKSFSARKILDFLAEVSSVNASESPIGSNIIIANPILEAFGNAKMPRNDDSSRFGKLFKIAMDDFGAIVGCTIETYLLEKSRTCRHGVGERNFHVFYMILAYVKEYEPDWKDEIGLGSDLGAKDYRYLSDITDDAGNVQTLSNDVEILMEDDADKFQCLVDALTVCNFSDDDQLQLWRMLVCVIKLGNISFLENADGKAEVDDMDPVEEAAALLGVDPEDLATSLCSREFQNPTPGKEHEFIKFAATTAQAQQNRDAMAKSIYSGMFDNIVSKVNKVFHDSEALDGFVADDSKFISVLDIFGFEVLESNSLEQLLINFTNEKLHDYFSRHMYADQIELLQAETDLGGEGLSYFMDHVNEISNEQANRVKHLADVVLGNCLDEISAHPKGQDSEFVDLLRQHPNEQFMAVQTPEQGGGFSIEHFAEAVTYKPEGFVDKNKFKLYSNLTKTITSGSNQYLQTLITSELEATSQNMYQRFSSSLNSLIELLDASAPRFIRCLKSNMKKAEWHFEPEIVHRQLIYASLLQTVRICTMGYPEQLPFEQFYLTYRALFLGESREMQQFEDSIGGIEKADEVSDDTWVKGLTIFVQCCEKTLGKRIADLIKIGSNAVLLRDEASQALDVRKQNGITQSAETIAAAVQAAMQSYEYNRYHAALTLQSVCRAVPARPLWSQLSAKIDINAACRAVLQCNRSWQSNLKSEEGSSSPAAVEEPRERAASAARERSNTATAKAAAAVMVQEAAEEALAAAQEGGDETAIATAEMELLEAQSAVADAEEEAAEAEEAVEEEEEVEEETGPKTLRVPSDHSTIAAAVAEAEDGDTVEVEPGQYAEALSIEKAIEVKGTARIGVMITVSAQTAINVQASGEVKLSNLTVKVTNAANNHNAVSVHSGAVTVQGCAFLGGFCGMLVHHSSSAAVRNSIIKNCSAGVVVDSSSHYEMDGCRCFSNKRCGVAILGDGSHGRLAQNEIYDNEGFAVGVWRKASLFMESCKVRGNEKGGVYVHGTGTSAEIERCEFGSDGSWQVAGKAKLTEKDNNVAPPDKSKVKQKKNAAEIVSGNTELKPVDVKTMTTATGRKILRIYLSDGTHNALAVEPSTTARQMCEMVANKKMWLKDDEAKNTQLIDGLALYETSSVPVNYRRRLLDDECPVEVMQNWASGRSHKFVLNTKRKGKSEPKGKSQVVRVYIVDGTHMSLSLPQNSSVKDTCQLLAQKRAGESDENASAAVNPLWDTFTLYEVNYAQDGSSSSWRSLGADESLQDVISSSPKGVSSLFLYKKRVFLENEDLEDAGYLHITYLQVITALRSRLFGSPAKPFKQTLSDADLVQMAALHLYYMLGPSQEGTSSTLSLLWRTMQSCVPSGVWKAYSPGATRACEEYAELSLPSQQEAARMLMSIARKYPHFGREFFPVRGQNPPVAIGVGHDGMLVVHAVTRAPIKTYAIGDMKDWAAATDQTVTTHLEFSCDGEKVSFITPDAYEIVLLLECYAKLK